MERSLFQRSSIGHPTLRKQTSQKISDQWKPDKQNSRFARHIHLLFSRAIFSWSPFRWSSKWLAVDRLMASRFLIFAYFRGCFGQVLFPHFSIMDSKTVQRSALCRSRRELSNAYLLAKIGVDTAENEPLEVWGENSIQYSLHSLLATT